ncbi:MAG: hypothetical protein ACHQ53_05720 [Polyangiales bacterium]
MKSKANVATACACWVALSILGCADGSSSTASSKPKGSGSATKDASAGKADAATGGDAAGPGKKDAGSTTVPLGGALTDFVSRNPIAGASLCITIPHSANPTCTQSASDGSYSIDIPADMNIAVTVHASGYLDAIIPEHVAMDTSLSLEPVTKADVEMQAAGAGVTLDDTLGHLALNIGAPGSTFSVKPASGTLLYFDASGVPSATETKTTSAGLGVLFNAQPGTYEATYDVGAHACEVTLGWPGSAANSVSAPVVAGSITSVGMGCI